MTVKTPFASEDNVSVDLNLGFVKDTLTSGRGDKFRGKMKPMYGIVNLRPDSFTSLVEKDRPEHSVSISSSVNSVHSQIVGVDIEAPGSGY